MNLDRHSLGIIISRIIGINALLHAITYFAFAATISDYSELTWGGVLWASVAFFATLGLSYFFLAHASQASRFLMSETQDGPKSEAITEASVIRTAFLIIGGYLFVQALPSIVGQLSMYFQGFIEGPRAFSHLAESSVRLLLGVFLMVGGGSWERLLQKLRS